jgi:hypothetical protein
MGPLSAVETAPGCRCPRTQPYYIGSAEFTPKVPRALSHEAVGSFATDRLKIQLSGDGSISWLLYSAKGSGTRRSHLGVT